MKLIEFTPERARPIELFESAGASAVALGDGTGEAHVYCLHFEPGGKIGLHPTGFGQLFLVVRGEGWACGADGRRVSLQAGQGVFFERGEVHSKGSETGMVAVVVQVSELDPRAPEEAD
jgi:quercetin dioxygenase-like cupin family protein